MPFTTEDAKAIGIIAGAVGAVGIAAYFVYALANPGPRGGSCTTPGTPCYEAVLPWYQMYQQCATQQAQLMNQILNSGQAPTAAQEQTLQQLVGCMTTAATNMSAQAANYVPTSWGDVVSQLLTDGLYIVLTAVGLAALVSYLKARLASGQLRTTPSKPAGVAIFLYDGFLQYASSLGLITSVQAAAWESAASQFTNAALIETSTYYNDLVTINLLSVTDANALIAADTSTISADLSTTDAILAALPMTAYEEAPRTSEILLTEPGGGCGCL